MPGKAVGMPGIYPGRIDALLGRVPTDTAPRDRAPSHGRWLSELDRRNLKRGGVLSPTHLWLDGGEVRRGLPLAIRM